MNGKISRLVLILIVGLMTRNSLANDCQLIVSPTDIQLGNPIYSATRDDLFTTQELTVIARCPANRPISILFDGLSDGVDFRFGHAGKMQLTLKSAKYNRVGTEVLIGSPHSGEQRLAIGTPAILTPGTQVTSLAQNGQSVDEHLLTLELSLGFPALETYSKIRDRTEMSAQIRMKAQQ
ncbi:hypothetical protein C3432_11955 [Citrobacter amalonaticus]|uniref:Fimbrial protein n=1 Tax=Citrobacter amalonaticus TaxID=35703 RepID=A0A2S4RRJ8_CITAM|nr:hypothetical protein [Citrobacter amalonaticus]POT58589.1 hypothetical protein C3432_11955 [Citrobacter amalonaticus]POT70327.1 hypothetical protein C3436_24655 [Citrobacter amalonaticus]POU61311.1 hypothetical protein C3430_23565 [Citrobacter amalonaticus]POV05120.1 hypothetical protein C3424_07165 [Citrobacter amalonaticus]